MSNLQSRKYNRSGYVVTSRENPLLQIYNNDKVDKDDKIDRDDEDNKKEEEDMNKKEEQGEEIFFAKILRMTKYTSLPNLVRLGQWEQVSP